MAGLFGRRVPVRPGHPGLDAGVAGDERSPGVWGRRRGLAGGRRPVDRGGRRGLPALHQRRRDGAPLRPEQGQRHPPGLLRLRRVDGGGAQHPLLPGQGAAPAVHPEVGGGRSRQSRVCAVVHADLAGWLHRDRLLLPLGRPGHDGGTDLAFAVDGARAQRLPPVVGEHERHGLQPDHPLRLQQPARAHRAGAARVPGGRLVRVDPLRRQHGRLGQTGLPRLHDDGLRERRVLRRYLLPHRRRPLRPLRHQHAQ